MNLQFCVPDSQSHEGSPSQTSWETTDAATLSSQAGITTGPFDTTAACRFVSEEFPDACGACHPDHCSNDGVDENQHATNTNEASAEKVIVEPDVDKSSSLETADSRTVTIVNDASDDYLHVFLQLNDESQRWEQVGGNGKVYDPGWG